MKKTIAFLGLTMTLLACGKAPETQGPTEAQLNEYSDAVLCLKASQVADRFVRLNAMTSDTQKQAHDLLKASETVVKLKGKQFQVAPQIIESDLKTMSMHDYDVEVAKDIWKQQAAKFCSSANHPLKGSEL